MIQTKQPPANPARLTQSSERVVEEIRRLVERADQVDIPSDLLTRRVEAARAQLLDLVSSLQEAAVRDTERQVETEQAAASPDRLLQRMTDLPAFEDVERSVEPLETGTDSVAAVRRAHQAVGRSSPIQRQCLGDIPPPHHSQAPCSLR
jgi:hypothetical protein